ncbi:uncharacterized protein BDV14DRAFT_198144 [Aspergillus stella-maris]|uniref:uncharacterized protein n=1 Tax=Aspergillus stella-maris TaxID=1810926 RepID=UPI003CCD06C6
MSSTQPSPASASVPATASYCNICGGPLSSMHLRRASMADEGDDINWCHLDECDCQDYFEIDEEFDDPGGMDPAYHSSDCATQIGYVGWDLSEKDVLWLDEIRVIGEMKENQRAYPISKLDGNVFLTKIGDYTHAHGLMFESVALTFPNPSEDGFLVHDSCYRMLHLAASLDNKPLSLRNLYLTMKACPKDPFADMIDWKNPRSYGGTETWAHADGWRAEASYEWLVTDPFVKLSARTFLKYASQSSVVKQGSPTWGSATSRPRQTAGDNPIFTTLPLEIKHMIIEYLSSSSVLNLAIASPAFHTATRRLPNSFWKSRLQHDYRWLRGYFSELDLYCKSRPCLNYYALLMAFDYHSKPLPDGSLLKSYESIFFAFKNHRRIWNCAEAILSRVEARKAKTLVNHAMRVQQVDFIKYLRAVNTVYISLEKQLYSAKGFCQQGAFKKHGDGEKRPFGGVLFEFADYSTQYAGDVRLYESEKVRGEKMAKHITFFDVLGKELTTDTHRQWHDKMSSYISQKQKRIVGLDVKFRKCPEGKLIICGISPVTGQEVV